MDATDVDATEELFAAELPSCDDAPPWLDDDAVELPDAVDDASDADEPDGPPMEEALDPEEGTRDDEEAAWLVETVDCADEDGAWELPTPMEEPEDPVVAGPRHTPSSHAVWGPQSALTLQRSRHSPSWATVLDGQRVAHPRWSASSATSSTRQRMANGCCCCGGRMASSYNAGNRRTNLSVGIAWPDDGWVDVWLHRPPGHHHVATGAFIPRDG